MTQIGFVALGLQCTEDVRVVGTARPVALTAGTSGQGGSAGDTAEGAAGGEAGTGAVAPELGPFSVPRLVAELSDPDADDFEPTLTEDTLEIYFASTRLEGRLLIFSATRARSNDRWGAPRLVEELEVAGATDYSPELTDQGLTLWFVSDRVGTLGSHDVFVSRRSGRGSPWSTPEPVPSLNTPAGEIDPGPLPEHDQFVVTRVGELGHNHLLLARRANATAPWEPAVDLPMLNTAQKEGDPAFAGDGLVLYLATTRDSPNQDNRADIWRTTRPTLDAEFGPPEPVPELNSLEVDEQDPWLTQDERYIAFTSTRDGKSREIYEAFR